MASKNKSRKPLETTLGRARSHTEKDETIDLSHLRMPIETSIFGLTQVLTLFETATDEVRQYVAYECDILYECRICRTLFRSLANFILHKRSYCRERYRPARNTKEGTIINHMTESTVENPKELKKDVNCILDRLVEKQKNQQLTQSLLLDDCTTKSNSSTSTTDENEVALSIAKIDTSPSAVFQTVVNQSSDSDSMKSEVMEIHSIFENNEAIVGPDGKARVPPNKLEWHLKCTVCGLKFSTKKTLAYHVKYKHNGTQFIYPCPICKETMANAWSVFRHLFKIHRKTAQQVRKMRDSVHSSAIQKSYAEILSKKNIDSALGKLHHGNQQWMNDFECDSDLKMCGGCGKRFERKAALHSHLQVCLKRSVAIKEDNAKRAQSDDKQLEQDSTCLFRDPTKSLRAHRRKPSIVVRRSRQVVAPRKNIDDQDDCKGFGSSELIESCRIREFCRQASPIARVTEKRREVKEKASKPVEIITRDDIDLQSTPDKDKSTNGEVAAEDPIDNITLIIKKDKYGDTKVIRKGNLIGVKNQNKRKPIHKTKSSIIKQKITKSGTTRKTLVKNMSNNNSLTAVVQDNNSTIQKENDEPGEVNASYATEDAYTYENITNFDAKSDMIIISDFYTKSEDSFLSSKDTNRTDSDKSLLTRDDGSTDELSSGSFGDKDMTLRTLLGKTPATENRCINLKIKRLADMISADQDNSPSCSNSLDLCQEPLSPDIVIADDCEDTRHIITKDEDGNAKLTTAPLKRKRVNNQLGNFRRKTVKLAKEYRMFMKMANNYINLKRNECTRCKLRYPTVGLLMQHMALHFHWLRFQCGMCNIMFFEKGDCRSHVVQSHSDLENCDIDDTVVSLTRSKMKSLWTEFQELDYVDEENLKLEEDTSREEQVLVGNTEMSPTINENQCLCPSPFGRSGGFGKPNIQDPHVRDMVMEVIFGSTKEDPKDIPNSPESCLSEQSDSNLLENNRPMRSHVKPIQKDFLYEYNFVTKGYGHNMKKQGSTNSDDDNEVLLESVPNTLENIDNLLNEGSARLHLKTKPLKVYKKKVKEASARGLGDDVDEKAGKQMQIGDISA